MHLDLSLSVPGSVCLSFSILTRSFACGNLSSMLSHCQIEPALLPKRCMDSLLPTLGVSCFHVRFLLVLDYINFGSSTFLQSLGRSGLFLFAPEACATGVLLPSRKLCCMGDLVLVQGSFRGDSLTLLGMASSGLTLFARAFAWPDALSLAFSFASLASSFVLRQVQHLGFLILLVASQRAEPFLPPAMHGQLGVISLQKPSPLRGLPAGLFACCVGLFSIVEIICTSRSSVGAVRCGKSWQFACPCLGPTRLPVVASASLMFWISDIGAICGNFRIFVATASIYLAWLHAACVWCGSHGCSHTCSESCADGLAASTQIPCTIGVHSASRWLHRLRLPCITPHFAWAWLAVVCFQCFETWTVCFSLIICMLGCIFFIAQLRPTWIRHPSSGHDPTWLTTFPETLLQNGISIVGLFVCNYGILSLHCWTWDVWIARFDEKPCQNWTCSLCSLFRIF